MFSANLSGSAPVPTEAPREIDAEMRLRQLLAGARTLIEAVASGQSMRALLQIGIELAAELLQARYAAIGVLDGRDEYQHFLYTGLSVEQAQQIGAAPKAHGILRRIMEQREPLRVNNLGTAARGAGFPPHHPRMETLLAAPVFSGGRPYGRMYVCNRRDGAPFTALDETILAHLVQYLTLAVEQAHPRDADREAVPDDAEDADSFRRLLDLSPGAILVIQDGLVAAANRQAATVLGARTLGELVGRPVETLVHAESQATLARRLAEGASSAQQPRTEFRTRRLDGTDGWIEEESARIRYLGRPAMLVSIKDISADQRARTQLARLHTLAEQLNLADSAEAMYRAGLTALRGAADADRAAIRLFDRNRRMRFVAWDNLSARYREAADALSNWTPDDVDAQPTLASDPRAYPELAALVPHLEAEGIASLGCIPIVHQRRLLGKVVLYFDTRREFPPATQRHLLAIAEHFGIALSRQQAAERSRRANAQLEQRMRRRTRQLEEANRDLEAFSYSVSHDLRAPLRAMNGFATILLAEHAGALDPTGRAHLNRIVTASRHMERLIDDLLRLSRVNRLAIQPVAVDLTAMAHDIATRLSEAEPQRNVSWEIEPGLAAEADPGLARILLENLIENAWKYTGRKAAALIRFGRAEIDGRAALEVSDNGAGFDMQYAEKLFAPFQRLHTPAEFAGTGIGLAIVQRILRRHGGSIVASARRDEGARFRFSFWDDGRPDEFAPGASPLDLQQ